MSGICGIVELDGNDPNDEQIVALTREMARRGPDGRRSWREGPVALGHVLLATTPEAVVEQLPFTDRASDCTITADARLDNREDLLSDFGLDGEQRTIGDGELILRAYHKWNEDCPNYLLGDFAFAIWDARATKLFCARDQVGMRQLTYCHVPGRHFIFATDPDSISALPGVETTLNHARVGDFLSNMEGADLTSTFFNEIFRLPPAHVLIVDRCEVEVRRYWALQPQPELKLPSDQAYEEAFLAVFTEAVRCRLRSAGPVGAMLSGGIDSNAVVAVAARLAGGSDDRLLTFSAVGPSAAQCIETRTIQRAQQVNDVAAFKVNHADLESIRDDLIVETVNSTDPFDGGMALIRSVYLSAKGAGVKVVLDGVNGDVVLSSDFHATVLLRQGKLVEALKEVRGERQYLGPHFPAGRGFVRAAWHAFMPAPLKSLKFWLGRRKADRTFVAWARETAPYVEIDSALGRRRGVQRRDLERDRIDSFMRIRTIAHPDSVVGRERYDRVAAALGIEPRDPFNDLRLIRFCLSLPRRQLQRNGWSKWILRRAISRYLPGNVTWRRGKEHLGGDFAKAIYSVVSPNPAGAAAQLAEEPDPATFYRLSETTYLSNWFAFLSRNGRSFDQEP